MKIAFTSSTGEMIDQHFGQCQSFHIWEVGPDEAAFLTTISAITTAEDEEDRIMARATAIADCAIVYTMQIGGPAAAKLVARQDPPDEDRLGGKPEGDRRTAPGSAARQPAAMAQKGNEQGTGHIVFRGLRPTTCATCATPHNHNGGKNHGLHHCA